MTEKGNLEQSVRKALDARSEGLDADTLARLTQSRVRALQNCDDAPLVRRLAFNDWLVPAAGLAGVAGAVIGLIVFLQPATSIEPGVIFAVDDEAPIAIATADVAVELLEDIDFYDWLTLSHPNGDSA